MTSDVRVDMPPEQASRMPGHRTVTVHEPSADAARAGNLAKPELEVNGATGSFHEDQTCEERGCGGGSCRAASRWRSSLLDYLRRPERRAKRARVMSAPATQPGRVRSGREKPPLMSSAR